VRWLSHMDDVHLSVDGLSLRHIRLSLSARNRKRRRLLLLPRHRMYAHTTGTRDRWELHTAAAETANHGVTTTRHTRRDITTTQMNIPNQIKHQTDGAHWLSGSVDHFMFLYIFTWMCVCLRLVFPWFCCCLLLLCVWERLCIHQTMFDVVIRAIYNPMRLTKTFTDQKFIRFI